MTTTQFTSSILQELSWRGLIHQHTHDALDEALHTPTTLYCGFDPSADSLHVGNLIPMMGLAFFRRHGHRPMALVGGATGMIGDPSGKSEERVLQTEAQIAHNLAGIRAQLQTILDRAMTMHPELVTDSAQAGEPIPLLNNADWIAPWSFIDFLRDVGQHFRVNQMLAKDSVRTRLEEREQGLSYTEFSYMLIQGYDFYHLQSQHGCTLQIGGSDQWGNITAGTELVRRKGGAQAYGMTFPLLTTADGKKFGKSERGAIWLDAARTSPYQFYQYWVSQQDADLPRLLRTYTFMARAEVEALIEDVAQGRNRGHVQQRLAYEVTSLVHGAPEADRAVRASKMLFGETISDLSDAELASIFADVPSTTLERARLDGEGASIVELLAEVGLQKSRGEARRLLQQGGVYVNNVRVDAERAVTVADLASASCLVLRAGKKAYHVIRLT